jgi:hypothetical protein
MRINAGCLYFVSGDLNLSAVLFGVLFEDTILQIHISLSRQAHLISTYIKTGYDFLMGSHIRTYCSFS